MQQLFYKRWYKIALLIVSYFRLGFFPVAPGTVGTLAAIPLVIFLDWLAVPSLLLMATVFLWFLGHVCIYIVQTQDGMLDYSWIVIDEVVGFFVAMNFLPVNLWTLVLAFLFFRYFDIVKPFPIGYINARLKGAAGVMLDDAVAGVLSGISILVLIELYGRALIYLPFK